MTSTPCVVNIRFLLAWQLPLADTMAGSGMQFTTVDLQNVIRSNIDGNENPRKPANAIHKTFAK